MSLIRKLSSAEKAPSEDVIPVDASFGKKYPALWEFMVTSSYEDGSPRKRSTVSVFVQEGQWKCCLRDPDNARVLWATGNTFTAAIEALDALAGQPEALWREDRYSNESGTAKRRKTT